MDPRDNRPRARDKNVTSGGSGVHRRGDGLGTGPVGQGGSSSGGGSGLKRAAAGGGGVGLIILILALVMGGGNSGGGSGLLGSLLSSDTGSVSSICPPTSSDSALYVAGISLISAFLPGFATTTFHVFIICLLC